MARKTREARVSTAHSPNRTRGHAFFSRAFHLADFLGKVGLLLVWDVEDGIKIFEKNFSTVRNKIVISPEKNRGRIAWTIFISSFLKRCVLECLLVICLNVESLFVYRLLNENVIWRNTL